MEITSGPLGDNISSVQLVDHMGDDLMVVNAARVSMAKESGWEHDSESLFLSERDKTLISYLARHNHWTPFSHPQIQLRIKMPIFIARQWFKHMVGFTRNEVSRRYVDDTPEVYVPTEWRKRAANVKQGSSDELVETMSMDIGGGESSGEDTVWSFVHTNTWDAIGLYETMIIHGICPEQARMVLPQSMYTEFVETGSLAAYARLCNLRLDPHAQKEVRLYAEAIYQVIKELFPVSAEVLVKQ